jgi:triosephosphate isomerase
MAKKKIVIANWKMRLSLAETIELARNMKDKFKGYDCGTVVVCPNFLSLLEVGKELKSSVINLGAQDVFWEDKGAYTGETSPIMLTEGGCRYAIVGHSERRKFMNENYEMIHKKLRAVLNAPKLIPILCIGENWDERKTDRRDFVLVDQLNQALSGLSIVKDEQIIIAYEPIWAIGSGLAIEPAEAEYAHKIIKLTLNDMFGLEVSNNNFSIVYGGSIDSKNVKGFVGLENIDGLLVGGASLKVDDFYRIAKAICK